MAGRIRTIKPEILDDGKTGALSDQGFRLFIGMILLADDHGGVRADTRWLEGQVWWASRGNPRRVAAALEEIFAAGLIILFRVGEQPYASIRNWSRHQRVDNAGKPRVPLHTDKDAVILPAYNFRGENPRLAEGDGETPLDHDHRPPTIILSGKPDGLFADPDVDLPYQLAAAHCEILNAETGSKYRPDTGQTITLCRALVRQHRTTLDQVRRVTADRCAAWKGDPQNAKWLRPATILAAKNFAKYLDDLENGAAPTTEWRMPEV